MATMGTKDPRFIRDNRSLAEWIPDLISSERLTRRAAENALSAMWWGVPVADLSMYSNLPADPAKHRADWESAVESVLADESFQAETFFAAAFALLAKERDRVRKQFELEERLFELEEPFEDELPERPKPEVAELVKAIKSLNAEKDEGRFPNSMGPHILEMILKCAGKRLITMPEYVRAGLQDKDRSSVISESLSRVGVEAREFAPDLLSCMLTRSHPSQQRPDVLAAIAKDDAGTVRNLVDLIKLKYPDELCWLTETLGRMGSSALEQVPMLVDELLPLSEEPEIAGAILLCLSKVDPTRRDVFDRVLCEAAPREPKMVQAKGSFSFSYDENVYRRGAALEALGNFKPFAGEAVVVLIDALDSFQEYDPDWSYERGDHGRVIQSLRMLQPESTVAASALSTKLRRQHGEVDWEVIRFLGEIGAAAQVALPALIQLGQELPGEPASETPNPVFEPLAWAIERISGRLN